MPPSSLDDPNSPRIKRGIAPAHELNEANVRTAKPYLLRDTGGRCAYSMIHEREIGKETIEVEHFDPRKTNGEKNHNYSNLLPSYGPCNRAKGNKWPTAQEQLAGYRFLNPTVERDYGVHLFEDPESHKIVGCTPQGKYHVRYLALNTELLIRKRKRRLIAKSLRRQIGFLENISPYSASQINDLLGDDESAIPEIPPPPY